MAASAAPQTFDWAYIPPRRSFGRRMLRLIRLHPMGFFGLIVLVLFVLCGLFGERFAPYGAEQLSAGKPLEGPTREHWFGNNLLGQDVFSRILAGARISFIISFWAVFLGAGTGAFLGILGGYFGRWLDYAVQRSGEAFAAFPGLILFLMLRTAFGPNLKAIIASIAIGALFGGNRVLRGQTILEKNQIYVEAARSVGCSEWRIFLRHVVPNVLPLVVVIMSGALGAAILAESALAFLGLGPEEASWGRDMSGQNLSIARTGYWHVVVFPGIAISLVVLGANLLGDSLRDIWDPRLRK